MGDQLLHLALALVASSRQELSMILVRQVRSEQPHGGEVNIAVLQELEDPWELAHRSSCFDSDVGRVLGQVQNLRTVGEQGGAAFLEVESPLIELGQVSDELRGRPALALHETFDRYE